MTKARAADDHPTFCFDEPAIAKPEVLTRRDHLLEQIVRDSRVLLEDEEFWAPSYEFYVERIARFKKELEKLDV